MVLMFIRQRNMVVVDHVVSTWRSMRISLFSVLCQTVRQLWRRKDGAEVGERAELKGEREFMNQCSEHLST